MHFVIKEYNGEYFDQFWLTPHKDEQITLIICGLVISDRKLKYWTRLRLTTPNQPQPDERKQTLKKPPHLTPDPETYYPPHNTALEQPCD
jgi:hypothetical protein